MKTLTANAATQVALGSNTIAYGFDVTRDDGTVLAVTSHDIDDTVDGVTYLADPGVDVSSIVIQSGFAVGNGSATFLFDESIFDRRGIHGGVWRNAAWRAFKYNFATLELIEWISVGTVGEVNLLRSQVAFELRDLRQALNVSVGRVRQTSCPYRVGSTGRCGVRLDPPAWAASTAYTVRQARDAATGSVVKPTTLNDRHFKCTTAGTSGSSEPTWNTTIGGTTSDGTVTWTTIQALTVEGTLSSFTSDSVFRDSSRLEADDFFAEGYITITSGDNDGISRKIRTFEGTTSSPAANGTFTLWEPFPYEIDGTETYTAVAGDRKRLTEDCIGKFDNVLNFGGEPHAPTQDEIAQAPEVAV